MPPARVMQNFAWTISFKHFLQERQGVRKICAQFFLAIVLKLSSVMTLRASLLRELGNPNLSVGQRVELCCELAKEFENKGEYEDAREVLGDLWPRIDQRPRLTDLEPSTAGEVLLRAGVLTGWIGSRSQIADAQERAKNLISESLTIFESLKYRKKITEAQTELALCYWRTGEVNEARDLLNEALQHLTTDSELRAKAALRLAIVERTSVQYEEALRILNDNAALFQRINNQTLKGCYHDALANVLKDLAESEKLSTYADRALIEYAAASYHFELAEHRSYLASVENNLGVLYFKINQCDEAHEHLNRARRLFVRLKDAVNIAQVDETRASVFLRQGRFAEAERAARSSVRRLDKGERQGVLVEALVTHGRALARLGSYNMALHSFRRAFDLAERNGSTSWAAQAALAAFHEIGDRLTVVEGQNLLRSLGDRKQMRSLEHEVIKLALENAKGSVTYAARALGMSYQALTYMLDTRHKDLLTLRTPPRPRRRK